jgi:succinate dehydrogenase/fumarate reductase flavoprotein subunit
LRIADLRASALPYRQCPKWVVRPGLYFIGEVVDVTGHLGGFNFQWAWSSGVAAGRHIADGIGRLAALDFASDELCPTAIASTVLVSSTA